MEVREAVEADAEALAAIADAPADVMRNLVHDRSVRVAVEGDGDATDAEAAAGAAATDATGADADGDESASDVGESILGFVSFDAHAGAVHVTQLAGSAAAVERLLDAPVSFARREGMSVELLVPEGDETVQGAVEDAGFADQGAGPVFAGEPTVRYRLEP